MSEMTLEERRERLVSRMGELGFLPAPGQTGDHGGGVVTAETAEGIYYNIGKDSVDFQLLIVGPMAKRPGEYAALFDGYLLPVAIS